MALERVQMLAGVRFRQPQGPIVRRRCQSISRWREGHAVKAACMVLERVQWLPRLRIPHLHREIELWRWSSRLDLLRHSIVETSLDTMIPCVYNATLKDVKSQRPG